MERIRLIQKVLEGKADGREKAELDALMERDATVRQDYEDLKLLVGPKLLPGRKAWADDREWRRIEGRIKGLQMKRRLATSRMVAAISVAAMVFVVAGWTHVLQRIAGINETLLFEDRPVSEVLQTVKRKKGFSFQVCDARAIDDRFSGAFFKGTTPEQISETLSLATGCEIRVVADARE